MKEVVREGMERNVDERGSEGRNGEDCGGKRY